MKTLLLLIVLVSCGKKETASLPPCAKQMEALNGQPTTLVVGDSVSLGYTPTLKEEFTTSQVIHTACNSMNTTNGVKNVSKWAAHSPTWEVCTINHGLWDINPKYKVNVEKYVSNLRQEIETLKPVCDKILFVTTTQVNTRDFSSKRSPANVVKYNQEATALMTQLNVPVCDLNATSLTLDAYMIDAVHYNKEGYEILGNVLKDCINNL